MSTEIPVEIERSSLAALYVGDLDVSVTEEELSSYFQQKGEVESVKICRDQTEQPLGHGFVNFRDRQHAEKAKKDLNFTILNGKPINISFSFNDPSYKRNIAANVFVKNLHKQIENKELYDMFSKYGEIVSSKVEKGPSGESKGFGYVQFINEESAKKAMLELNGVFLYGLEVYVGPFVSKQERQMAIDKNKFTNVFVKNLSEPTNEHDLRNVFSEFGSIKSLAVMRDEIGKSKCFGFVDFETADDAMKAVELLNGKEFNGKKWFVGRAQKKKEREAVIKEAQGNSLGLNNLYVKNLDYDIDDDKLKDLFSSFGTIKSCKVMCAENGISKGSGFVAFSTSQEASAAISEMNGKMVGRKPLYVAIAEKKEDRRAYFQSIFSNKLPHTSGPTFAPHVPMYAPPSPGLSFYGQAPPTILPSTPGFGYQPQFVPGIFPNMLPMIHRAPQGVHPMLQQQVLQKGNAFNLPPGYDMSSVNTQGVMGGSTHLVAGEGSSQTHERAMYESMSVGALASALANASPINQRQMLGEKLFPLVEKIEREMAPKVTGMLLEMDEAEVIHLLDSPESLRAKIAEAVAVLEGRAR